MQQFPGIATSSARLEDLAKAGVYAAPLQGVEKCEQPVLRLIAPALLSVERLDPGQRRLLQCKVGVQCRPGWS